MEKIIYKNEVAYKTQYEGYYVTETGKVITTKKKGGQGSIDLENPREHNYKIDKDGYKEVCLSLTENRVMKRKYVRVHRLVYENIVGNIPDGMTIDHIDEDVKNNNINNLQIMSRSENSRKAKLGKSSPNRLFYNLYKDEVYLGSYDRKGLFNKIGLVGKDFYFETKNVKQLSLQGYKWNLESVEDIEKVS